MDRPRTGSSVAYSEIGSISSASQSCTGSQLNALVARRGALRAQLAAVEHQLTAMPPSTAASSLDGGRPRSVTAGRLGATGPMPAPITIHQTPAREATTGTMQVRAAHEKRPAVGYAPPASGTAEDALPGAMRPGRYAFWPKRLPGAAAARRPGMSRAAASGGLSVATISGPAHRQSGMVVSGGIGTMPARGLAASAGTMPAR